MKEKRPFLPLILITFANITLLGFLTSMRGVSFPLIRNSFNASYETMGLMNGLIYLAAVCSCIIAGIYMNRFGLKKAVLSAFLLVVLGAGSIYFATGFWMAAGFYLILQSGFVFFEISINGVGVKVFTVKPGLMMNLLHFFFGVGAIVGPRFMGLMVNRVEMSWREVYPLSLVVVIILLVMSLLVRFPAREEATDTQNRPSFWTAMKEPMVWFLGIALGIACGIEGFTVGWSGLYLQDVHGLEPSTTGAAFVSAFFFMFTISRLVSGFAIEKIGYIKSVLVSSLAIAIIFVAAFSLGRRGIFLLPVTGFFVAIMWPTIMAIGAGIFKERAQTAISAIIAITFTLNGLIQYGVGLTNSLLGAAWGYRSCLIYSIILGVMFLILARKNKVQKWCS